MPKVNGFVEMESQAVISGCELLLARIADKRKSMKDGHIRRFVEAHTRTRWYDSLFGINRPTTLTDEEAEELMDKESAKEIFGSTLEWGVNQYYRDDEEKYMEIKKAAIFTKTILVNSEIAAKFAGVLK